VAHPALAAQRLTDELGPSGALELPRRPSGRVDRDAADAVFTQQRARVEDDPDDWRGWYRLGEAYDVAGDRRRAREALRTAIARHDQPVGP
jgi:cytochrome c-type biogenesis protein CcmH/NrfG